MIDDSFGRNGILGESPAGGEEASRRSGRFVALQLLQNYKYLKSTFLCITVSFIRHRDRTLTSVMLIAIN